MTLEEQYEALQAICRHYAMPLLLEEFDTIIRNIEKGILSVPLDKDPEKAALTLYAERMRLEGAVAVRNVFTQKVKQFKELK